MELQLKNKRQHRIADALWACGSLEETEAVIERYGQEAELIKELMYLAWLDEQAKQIDPLVRQVLAKFG
jgi:hypothetical protein